MAARAPRRMRAGNVTLRRGLFLAHRYVGLGIALFLMVAAVTGTLLTFRDRVDAELNPGLFRVPAGPVRPASELVARVLADHPSWRVVRFAMQPHSGEALRAVMVRTPDAAPDDVFIDPRDGGVTGTRTRQAGLDRAHAMQWLYDLHATLALGTAGRLFMGAIATCWLGLTVIGLAITLPRRRPLLAAWQPAWRLNRQTLGRRPWPELHRVIGLWTIPFMIVMALTSVAMNFFDEAFVPVATFLSPPRAGSPFADDAPPPATHAGPLLGYAIAEAIARTWAAHAHPDMQPVALTDDPARDLYGISFAPGGTALYTGFGRITCHIDRHDGHIAWIDDPHLDGAGTLAIRALYPLHSGQVAGWPTMACVLATGIATGFMIVSGVLPWLRRQRSRSPARPMRSPGK